MQIRRRAEAGGRTAVFDRDMITEHIAGHIGAGLVRNREDVAAALAEIGEITRQGENYISVRPDGAARAVRLKGAFYERDFDGGAVARRSRGESGSRKKRRPGSSAKPSPGS